MSDEPEAAPRQPQTPDELLRALVEAERKIQPDAISFIASASIGPRGVRIVHRGLHGAFRARATSDIHALADSGHIRLRKKAPQMVFDLTPEGRKHADLLAAIEADGQLGPAVSGHPLDWNEQVMPVLAEIGRAYRRARPGLGLDSSAYLAESGREDGPALGLVFESLISVGFIIPTVPSDVSHLPRAFRLRERGLQATAGWPSGETAAAALLAAISARIDMTDSPEERTKLERLRESLTEIGQGLLGNILANVLTAQLPPPL
jgi:hypothetical protein